MTTASRAPYSLFWVNMLVMLVVLFDLAALAKPISKGQYRPRSMTNKEVV